MSNLIVGLTGGIGSGKSAAAKHFQTLGIQFIDADQASRDVVAPGEPALAKIAEHFGPKLILPDGNLNRAQMREVIFNSPEQKAWLEKLLHPLIRQRLESFLRNATSPYALLVSPLMVETNQSELVTKLVVVDVPEAMQISRTITRDNNSEALVKSIMEAQATREQRHAAADYIIDNSGDLHHLYQQVEAVNESLLALAKESGGEG